MDTAWVARSRSSASTAWLADVSAELRDLATGAQALVRGARYPRVEITVSSDADPENKVLYSHWTAFDAVQWLAASARNGLLSTVTDLAYTLPPKSKLTTTGSTFLVSLILSCRSLRTAVCDADLFEYDEFCDFISYNDVLENLTVRPMCPAPGGLKCSPVQSTPRIAGRKRLPAMVRVPPRTTSDDDEHRLFDTASDSVTSAPTGTSDLFHDFKYGVVQATQSGSLMSLDQIELDWHVPAFRDIVRALETNETLKRVYFDTNLFSVLLSCDLRPMVRIAVRLRQNRRNTRRRLAATVFALEHSILPQPIAVAVLTTAFGDESPGVNRLSADMARVPTPEESRKRSVRDSSSDAGASKRPRVDVGAGDE